MAAFVNFQDGLSTMCFEWFYNDGIAVIIVDDKNEVVTRTRWGNKLARLE